jgi:hypothetical protein
LTICMCSADSICSTVACGQGNCTVAPDTLGYRCDCRPGWTQLHVGDSLRFLPCVIPNCKQDTLLLHHRFTSSLLCMYLSVCRVIEWDGLHQLGTAHT